jgi:hypothetical protein
MEAGKPSSSSQEQTTAKNNLYNAKQEIGVILAKEVLKMPIQVWEMKKLFLFHLIHGLRG